MATTTKIDQIGFKQAAQLANMPAEARLNFTAEGLPIIFASAQSLMAASRALGDHPREAEILEGHAVEECAKLLILVDLLRCPPKRTAARIGPMMRWFYSHQARLIYAAAQSWKPVNGAQLQEYVDHRRPTYYLEGGMSEYILPNWPLFRREWTLYADVIGNEDADPAWSSPLEPRLRGALFDPPVWRVVDALDALGLLSRQGAEILQVSWGAKAFDRATNWSETRTLCEAMALAAASAGLLQHRLSEAHVSTLYGGWQMPMYEIDFSPIPVTLEEIKAQRDAAFWNEV